MTRGLLSSALALASLASGVPAMPGQRRLRTLEPPPPVDHTPLRVACPRCHAQPGEPCDRRTLRAHHYHQARVIAAKETR